MHYDNKKKVVSETPQSIHQPLNSKVTSALLSVIIFIIVTLVADEMVRAYKKTAENFSENLEMMVYVAVMVAAVLLSLSLYTTRTKKISLYDSQKSFGQNVKVYAADLWRNNFFAKHWRGEYSLPRCFWINYLLLNMIVSVWIGAYIKNIITIELLNYTLFLLIAINIFNVFFNFYHR